MERNREARRASIVGSVGSNGFNRRRHRTSLRDSPDDDGGLEFQESMRLRDRVKKDRDRDRDRERDRERERDRDRERERERERDLRERSSRSKRRRAERLTTANRDDIGEDETSEESVNDEEVDEDEENTSVASGVRPLTQAVGSVPNNHHHGVHHNHHQSLAHNGGFSQPQNNNNSTTSNITSSSNHHLQPRKSYPPTMSSAKPFRGPPVWKSGDEIISVSVPRKARSASTKRSHDWISSSSNNNNGGIPGGEQILRQASSSPGGQGLVQTSSVPMSPSSSNASARKKLKPSGNSSGPKLKPPKVSSSKPSSSNPEELEIEIAEVLYGLMTQTQGPSSKKEEPRDVNRSNSDGKSRNSSPISNSTSTTNHISGPNSSPLSAVAPKRKRPRQIPENSSYGGARSSPVSAKPDAADQTPKSEISSPCLEKSSAAAAESGYDLVGNSVNSRAELPAGSMARESTKPDLELKVIGQKESRDARDLVTKEEVSSPKAKEFAADRAEDCSSRNSQSTARTSLDARMTKPNLMVSDVENYREEKFEIDLMAPPPQGRSSPDREGMVDFRITAVDQKPLSSVADSGLKLLDKGDNNGEGGEDHLVNAATEEKKGKGATEEAEWKEAVENKRRHIDLQLNLEKPGSHGVSGAHMSGNKLPLQSQKQLQEQQLQLKPTREESHTDKIGHSTASLPFPLSVAGWPGGLPPIGYMSPLQGVVSMDGSSMTPAPAPVTPPVLSHPRPKRCATHYYIARNIHCLQQYMKMNPFWPPPTGSKPCNLNVMPAADLQGNIAVRGASVNNAPDKQQNLGSTPSGNGKEKGPQPASIPDSAQRKQQILIQQTLPPVAPTNLLGPAFIFPLSQQHATMAARPSAPKSPIVGTSSNNSSSVGASVSAAAPTMSFSYPNMPNEMQYLTILQNNAYPFPIPAAVGAPPNYRGPPAQAMPLFNSSLYPSQMIHPSQLQHPQQPPSSTQSQQLQNASASSGTSSSQKHLHNLQQRPQISSVATGSGSGNMQNFSSQKTEQSQQLQQAHSQYLHSSRSRQLEGGVGNEDNSLTTDSRASRAPMNMYAPNFTMPLHPQNYALLTPPAGLAGAAATSGSSGQTEKGHQPQQQQGSKNGGESMAPPQTFAMSFGPINGTAAAAGIDLSSIAQNHVLFKNAPEAARQNMQMMAAAAVAAQVAQHKSFRIPEDGNKSGGVDSSTTDEERKSLSGKAPGSGQSIAFSRSDISDGAAVSIQGNSVLESSRALNMASSGPHTTRPVMTNPVGGISIPNAHIQSQFQQQQQQQHKHQQQPQLSASSVTRNKVPVSSNGSIYPEHMNSSSAMAAKYPHSGFPQNLVQSNSSGSQWKSSNRMPTSQAPSSLGSSTAATLINIQQQYSRNQPQMHTQISFGGNQKQSSMSQGSNQGPSSPMMASSPTTSSVSKGGSGGPRTTTSSSNKVGQASSLSTQQMRKNSPSAPSQKSPSILGNPHIASVSSSNAAKTPMQQQQQRPNMMHQTQLFFSNAYPHSQPHSTSTSSTTGHGEYYMKQRRPPDRHQQGPVAPVTSSGVLSLGPPVTVASTSTNDPTKAIAAATGNVKGSGLPAQGIVQPPQFATVQSTGTILPAAGFSYVHPVPAAVQVKAAEQKQPAGHDNAHTWQSEKK